MTPLRIAPCRRRACAVARRRVVAYAFVVCFAGYAASATLAQDVSARRAVAGLPRNFVYLRDVAPAIQQDIRYASHRNFTGRPAAGYEAPECILTRATANALGKVQEHLPADRALKVYDCYRPERAVAYFIAWAHDTNDQTAKAEYYPTIDKSQLFERGYISRSSPHSRGTAVDVAIVDLNRSPEAKGAGRRKGACFGSEDERGYAYDDTLDFGTGYDCFHPLSATESAGVSASARRNREFLVSVMRPEGFTNYPREWWHFDFRGEPSRTSFDFPVRSAVAAQAKTSSDAGGRQGAGGELMHIGSKRECGEIARVKVVCVSGEAGAGGYAAPSSTSSLITHFLPSTGALECRRCYGDFAAYSRLDGVGRLTSPSPWCLVEHVNEDGTGSRIGWVNGRYLAPADAAEFECLQ